MSEWIPTDTTGNRPETHPPEGELLTVRRLGKTERMAMRYLSDVGARKYEGRKPNEWYSIKDKGRRIYPALQPTHWKKEEVPK